MVHSRWTHAGMIYRRSDAPQILRTAPKGAQDIPLSRPMVAEMANEESGFCLTDFESNLRDTLISCGQAEYFQNGEYPGDTHPDEDPAEWQVCVRFLNVERDDEFYRSIEETISKQFYNMRYRLNDEEQVAAAMDCLNACPCFGVSEAYDDPNTSFCSEFVATAWQNAGIISDRLNCAEFTPSHFGSTRSIKLQNGASLSKEYVLTTGSAQDLVEQQQGYRSMNTGREVPVLWPGQGGELDGEDNTPRQMEMGYSGLPNSS